MVQRPTTQSTIQNWTHWVLEPLLYGGDLNTGYSKSGLHLLPLTIQTPDSWKVLDTISFLVQIKNIIKVIINHVNKRTLKTSKFWSSNQMPLENWTITLLRSQNWTGLLSWSSRYLLSSHDKDICLVLLLWVYFFQFFCTFFRNYFFKVFTPFHPFSTSDF